MLKAIAGLATAAFLLSFGTAEAAEVTQSERFTTSDGVSVQTTLRGEAPLEARPVIVEFSPYGRNTMTIDAGPAYNHLLVQIRGTGDSDGTFDALGPRTQQDVAETLAWACKQPWSNGHLGLNGFSASAITIYNSLHLELPCVDTAVLKSGTFELYRDLLVPGGITNLAAGAGVLALIGTPALAQGLDRILRDPATSIEVIQGLLGVGLEGLTRRTLDDWWRDRGFRGDANDLPILMVDGFFDVESRGAFEAYRELRSDGAHLIVVNAHDAPPGGTAAGFGESQRWFDQYLLGVDNGIDDEPRVKLWMSSGDREDFVAGDFVRQDARSWPVPGTRWHSLALGSSRSGSASSINDGSLALGSPAGPPARQSYPNLPSIASSTDVPNIALVGSLGLDAFTSAFPIFTDMTLTEPGTLTYTSEPLSQDVLSAGPASLSLTLSSTTAESGVWVVVSDVSPDGTAHPVATGRLSTDFPGVIRKESLKRHGRIVQPYGDYANPAPAQPGVERRYKIELWPIGNRFEAGHRIRVHVTGASAASRPSDPALNTVAVGEGTGSRLMFPVLPGSNLKQALPGGR